MVLAMPRPQLRKGARVYRLRRRVPADLVAVVGRREVAFSLHTSDPNEAKRLFVEELAKLEARWAQIRQDQLACERGDERSDDDAGSVRHSLSERDAGECAQWMYAHWLALHRENPSQQRFWPTDLHRHLWRSSSGQIADREDGRVTVRAVLDFAQAEKVRELEAWCQAQAETVLTLRDIEADEASTLRVARAIAAQVQRASLTLAALGRGEPEAAAAAPQAAGAAARRAVKPVLLSELVAAWWRQAEQTGKSPSTRESYTNTIRQLHAFLGHEEAHRVTAEDVRRFRDFRLASKKRNGQPVSATTVKNSDLAALKSVFGWAVDNARLPDNPAAEVKVAKVAKIKLREREFTADEASAILRAARHLQPGRELPQTLAAKRWVPWLLAFTGARVGEIVQLRRQDLRREKVEGYPAGVWVLRITPEAGAVKTKQAREVPLHQQLVELGFPAFVKSVGEERLFLVPDAEGGIAGPLQAVKNRLGEFGREYVSDRGVSPNHGWRHRFRTVGTEVGIPGNVIDALCGWSAKSVGERYGSVSLKARADAIARLPWVAV
ncbi:Tyrosine recombinase XerC [Methylobacterium brachiatum]|jgi:integrase|nr:Tyrosine recombinase XerC [Methylobacterium brachiatum]